MQTTNEVAKLLGVSPSRVRQICCEHRIGTRVGTMKFFTAADVRKIVAARRPIGRPKQICKKSIDKLKRAR